MENNEPYYIEIKPLQIPKVIWAVLLCVWIAALASSAVLGDEDNVFLIFLGGAILFVDGGVVTECTRIRFYRTFFQFLRKKMYFQDVGMVELKKDLCVYFLVFTLWSGMSYRCFVGFKRNEELLRQVQELITASRESRTPQISPKYARKI